MTIDLRSDTLTKPTPGMLEAMMQAEVGDDMFGEDPAVAALEQKTAEMFGMEAALYCASGTMTNQIGIRLHTTLQDEVICHKHSHIYLYESGGIASNAGVSVQLLDGERGLITAEQVEAAIRPDDIHSPVSRLVALENTVNKGGGSCYDLAEIEKIKAVCDARGLALHLDGARLCNALVATGQSPEQYGQLFDTISLCLSKGLGAPVGSLLLGTAAHIKKARRIRKVMGGAWRQAGYMAAAGLYALENHRDRLVEDHQKAQEIAHLLAGQSYVKQVYPCETNILIFELTSDYTHEAFIARLAEHNILAFAFGPQLIRFVTHYDYTDDQHYEILNTLARFTSGQ